MEEVDKSYKQAACSALAFHKALIGLSQLNALEEIRDSNNGSAGVNGSIGLYTYYVVYHLFCSCILLLPKELSGKLEDPENKVSISKSALDNESESPDQWDMGQKLEKDWASSIKHKQIKNFCKEIRLNPQNYENVPFIKTLYEYFIGPNDQEKGCLVSLYEKLCYVRDRALYRPSCVWTSDCGPVQTSLGVGKELRSLPNSTLLYEAITRALEGITICNSDEKINREIKNKCSDMLAELWTSFINMQDEKYYKCLGICDEQMAKLEKYTFDKSLPSYITQMIELEGVEFCLKYKEKYWDPLLVITK